MLIKRSLLILIFIPLLLAGCVQFGKVVGKLLTSSTADLNEASTQVRFIRNTYPPETETTEAQYFKDWAPGRNILAVSSFKREGAGMLKIDGQVYSNGEPLSYVANGSYGKFMDSLDPQKVDIETSSGQTVSFEVEPIEEVKIKSINNGSGIVDLSKDLIIELDEPANTAHKNMRVMLLMEVLGARGWIDVANIKATEKIVIPAETFRHLPGVKPQSGDSYLLLERYRVSPNHYEGIGAAQVLSLSWDAVPVKVTNSADMIHGIRISNEIESENGTMNYTASKPNAFLGRPFSHGKKFALTSLTVRATKLTQSRSKTTTSTSYYNDYIVKTTTTTTTTRQFPKLPEVFWNTFLDNMYDDILATLNNKFSAEFIAMEDVYKAPSFAKLESINDGITEVEVSKSYGSTKPLLPTTLPAIMGSISTTFASDRTDARLINELGVDGLVAITIDLEMPWEEFSLSPRMSFRITGAPNGYIYGPTVYAEGVIHGNGMSLDELKHSSLDLNLVNKIVRQDELISAFSSALNDLETEEQEYGYDKIWALQD